MSTHLTGDAERVFNVLTDALNVANETTAHWRKRAWALERALAWIRDNPNDGHDVHEVACEALNRSATPVKP